MIKELIISNFQSWKELEIEFHPGVNIIVGASDSGKSAILRALRWLIKNRPQGDSMRSHWGGKTMVQIFTDNAHIARNKDKYDEYILGDQHFKAIRTEVPKEIDDALNISDINLQRQLDAPFLLSNTSGEIAQHFNKVANLDKIDSSTQKINSAIRELNSTIGFMEEQKKKLDGEVAKFEYLDKLEMDIEVLESMEQRLTNLQQKENKLFDLLVELQEVSTQINFESEILEYEKDVYGLLALYDKHFEIKEQQNDLQTLLKTLILNKVDMDCENNTLRLETPVYALLDSYKLLKDKENEFDKLYKLGAQIVRLEGDIKLAKYKELTLKDKFDKEFPDVCPLCGGIVLK